MTPPTDYLVAAGGEFEMVQADNPMHAARLALAAYGLNQVAMGAKPPIPVPEFEITVVGEDKEWTFKANPKQRLGLDVLAVVAL